MRHFCKCCKSCLKGFFSLTEQEFTFLGTITLVLLCQPQAIKPWEEIQYNNIFNLRGKNTWTHIITTTGHWRRRKNKQDKDKKNHMTFKNVPKPNCCPKTMKRKVGKLQFSKFQFSLIMICEAERMRWLSFITRTVAGVVEVNVCLLWHGWDWEVSCECSESGTVQWQKTNGKQEWNRNIRMQLHAQRYNNTEEKFVR